MRVGHDLLLNGRPLFEADLFNVLKTKAATSIPTRGARQIENRRILFVDARIRSREKVGIGRCEEMMRRRTPKPVRMSRSGGDGVLAQEDLLRRRPSPAVWAVVEVADKDPKPNRGGALSFLEESPSALTFCRSFCYRWLRATRFL